MNSRRSLLLLPPLLALLAACGEKQAAAPAAPFNSVDITGANYAKDFALPDADGRPRSIADFKGKVVVVFFGFTQCPDVCPTTMGELAAVKQALGKDGERLQGVFITVDPERDTPEVLKAYMKAFDPSFIALRGSLEQTRALAKDFKAFFAKVPGKEEGAYTMDHTAASYIYDTKGQLRLFARYNSGAKALEDDLRRLLNADAG